MALAPGTRVGSYEVTAKIGEGGMGEVYRARDTKLDRDVALKVLPDAFAQDAERLARFQREAKVLASLNHPNIAAIHGLEEADGVKALVLELVEGPTLADIIAARGGARLRQGYGGSAEASSGGWRAPRGLEIDEALPIAKQIAEALEAAHELGIIHRDLKPANVKVRPDGTVKVLDFGLAKALEPASALSPNLTQSPTITSPAMTQRGVILGTAAYMSPEQAKGREADKRSDIWAFGCVLYEMLSGRRAFGGEDVSETMAAVIRADPDWNVLPAETPSDIRRLLRGCLAKDPKARVREIAVARFELDSSMSGLDPGFSTRPADLAGRTALQRLFPIVSTGIATALVAGVGVWLLTPLTHPPPRGLTRFAVHLPLELTLGVIQGIAITRDGRRIVYNADQQLYVRSLDELDAAPIPAVEANNVGSLFVSPDGQWVGFNDTSNGAFKKVRMSGGPVAMICPAPAATGGFRGAAWGPAGTIVFATGSEAGLMQVSDVGGEPRRLTTPSEGEFHSQPHFLPDGRSLVFTIRRPGSPTRIVALSLETGEQRELLDGTWPHFATSSHLLFLRDDSLWAVPFDSGSLEVFGEAVPVLQSTNRFDLAADGTLVYASGDVRDPQHTLVLVDRQGREEAIGAPPRAYVSPRLSPDGSKVVFDIQGEIWTWEFARQTFTRLARGAYPVWTPDGRRIAFASSGTLSWQPADGTGSVERLLESGNVLIPTSFSPDGRLIFRETTPKTGNDLSMLVLDGERRATPLVHSTFNEDRGEVSPDGRWLAYQSNESGAVEVYVRPFPDVESGRWAISVGGGGRPLWARSGRELFYTTPTGAMMAVSIDPGPPLSFGAPTKVFEGNYVSEEPRGSARPYDVSPDGRRFLMIKRQESVRIAASPAFFVVENWLEELKRLVPTH
jgi:serine/threonine-protein kinase